jgi:hypothetical protein
MHPERSQLFSTYHPATPVFSKTGAQEQKQLSANDPSYINKHCFSQQTTSCGVRLNRSAADTWLDVEVRPEEKQNGSPWECSFHMI